ncbi:hypothetical protein BC659_2904 [Sediminibacterium goheungense]|uniref:Outer membrane protein with beta-barrel domain n=2 Tax=Sediminibacterium goheungense TaxID=1086393 RepID=A0A4R6ISD6_9BACT|nr:hypothetical protein BC659_2904 [Sediminibacterium goheungense]
MVMKKAFMRWLLTACFILFCSSDLFSQLELSHMLPRRGNKYGLGYGAILKFAFPSGEADFITMETGVKLFFEKESTSYGVGYIPVKVGYKYTFNREGTGIYAEPQLGFNVYGAESYYDNAEGNVDIKFNGVVGGAAFGFLFQPDRAGRQIDLATYIESFSSKKASGVSIGLRFTYNFTVGGSRY